jgi:hypothetical protein
MADLADLIERLKTGCVCIGSDEDNPGVELYDVEGASDTMAEAAAALSALLDRLEAAERLEKAMREELNAAREFVKRHPALTLIDLAEFEMFLKIPAVIDAALEASQ